MEPEESASEFLKRIGSKGGKAKVPKGTAVLTKRERSNRAKAAAKARWGEKARVTKGTKAG